MIKAGRDHSLDFMKGILIYLVVFGHVIAKYSEPGWVYIIIHTFHMPLFFFISGFLAASSMRSDPKSFMKKKIFRILVPALCWSLLFFIMKIPSSLDYPTKVIKSFMDIWFLYVLFYLYIVCSIICQYKKQYVYLLIIIVIGYVIYPFLLNSGRLFGYIVEEFRIIREMPVFAMGLLYYDYKDRLTKKSKRLIVVISMIVYVSCFVYSLFIKGHSVEYLLANENYIVRALAYQSATIISFSLFKWFFSFIKDYKITGIIEAIGQSTMGIYAMNGIVIFTIPVMIGVDYRFNLPLWLYAAVVTIVLFFFTQLMRRVPLSKRFLLGEK